MVGVLVYVVFALVYEKMTRDPSFEAFTHLWSGTTVWAFSGTELFRVGASSVEKRVEVSA